TENRSRNRKQERPDINLNHGSFPPTAIVVAAREESSVRSAFLPRRPHRPHHPFCTRVDARRPIDTVRLLRVALRSKAAEQFRSELTQVVPCFTRVFCLV